MNIEDYIVSIIGGITLVSISACISAYFRWKKSDQSERIERLIIQTREKSDAWRVEASQHIVSLKVEAVIPLGHRVLPYRKDPPVLKKPPPPPRSGGIPAPKKPVCAHLAGVPVLDIWGEELARICASCDAQVTNEEWVKVGW